MSLQRTIWEGCTQAIPLFWSTLISAKQLLSTPPPPSSPLEGLRLLLAPNGTEINLFWLQTDTCSQVLSYVLSLFLSFFFPSPKDHVQSSPPPSHYALESSTARSSPSICSSHRSIPHSAACALSHKKTAHFIKIPYPSPRPPLSTPRATQIFLPIHGSSRKRSRLS